MSEQNTLTIMGTTQILDFTKIDNDVVTTKTFGGNGVVATIAASKQCPVNFVSVIGTDLSHFDFNKIFGPNVNLDGLLRTSGDTFQYKVSYDVVHDQLIPNSIKFGVYETYSPTLNADQRKSSYVLLSGSNPKIGLDFLKQLDAPLLVGVDTQLYHLEHSPEESLELIKMATHLFLNHDEFLYLQKQFSNEFFHHCPRLQVIIHKKGKDGLDVIEANNTQTFLSPKIVQVENPLNAGDTISGTVMGFLASGVHFKKHIDEIVLAAQLEAAKVITDDPFYRKECHLLPMRKV